jgi:predicted ATP-dependent protease
MKEIHFVPVEHMDEVIAVALHTPTLSKDEHEVIPVSMKKVKARKVITPKAITSQIGVHH